MRYRSSIRFIVAIVTGIAIGLIGEMLFKSLPLLIAAALTIGYATVLSLIASKVTR
jgi:F0F1-type ATP synthase assembly protein I